MVCVYNQIWEGVWCPGLDHIVLQLMLAVPSNYESSQPEEHWAVLNSVIGPAMEAWWFLGAGATQLDDYIRGMSSVAHSGVQAGWTGASGVTCVAA